MDEDAVTKQLEKLNSILTTKIKTGSDPKKVYLLRQTLEEELGKLGFHPNLGKAVDFVRPDIFRAAITHGLLLKDSTLGNKDHGEFPHAIQWLLIAWQQQDNNFLGRPAVEIFKQLGEEEAVYSREALPPNTNIEKIPRPENSIWDLIINESEMKTDFRSPETLNLFIIKSQKQELAALQIVNKN